MAPPAPSTLWKSLDGFKFSTGDKFTSEQQLTFHNEGFTDYFVDFTFDVERFETGFGAQLQLVSFLSLYMHTDKDEFVGFARTALRGQRAWVGGFALAPSFRGKGIGPTLMREYLSLLRTKSAVRLVQLEVIKANPAALKLYQRSGFSVNFDLRDFVINDVQALSQQHQNSWKVSSADQLDAALPWLQHRLSYSWQRELSTLLTSCRRLKQFVVTDENGEFVVALAVETWKDPVRITGFAFEAGHLTSEALSSAIRESLNTLTKGAEVRLEPESSEIIPLLEAIDGCDRDSELEEHHMILQLDRPGV